MSVVGSADEYTEDELLQVCQEMGLPFNSENIFALKEAIDELVESCSESDDVFLDVSLFGSLALSHSSHHRGTRALSNEKTLSSPIQHLGTSRKSDDYLQEGKEIPLSVPSSQDNEEIKRHNPTAYFLLNDAWRCLRNVYGTMAVTEELERKLTSAGRYGSSSQRNISRHSSKRTGDNKENEGENKYCGGGPLPVQRSSSLPGKSYANDGESRTIPLEARYQFDPSLRHVEKFVPGKLLYRHDPVKKFELYREEWARKPAPGEEKRLALRWKVREYMLRQTLPDFDPRKPVRPYVAHAKDWSPQPYLD